MHPQVRANYLASPLLVVAFALAGRVDIDLTREPLGNGKDGRPVYLKDIWPTAAEVRDTMTASLKPSMFESRYASVFEGDEVWQGLSVPEGSRYAWDPKSTYVAEPPFFQNLGAEPGPLKDIDGARVLAVLGDSVTTDHISPAGSIPKNGPAARYLLDHGVAQHDWNTFGARRGHHEVMMRGTFGNVRIKNALTPDKEGNWTVHLPTGEVMSIFDASERYRASGTPLIVLAGKEYGTGSSRDWAAKGPALQGVKAAIAESYERIHRSNLVGMGVLPLAYRSGENRETLGLTGKETFTHHRDRERTHPRRHGHGHRSGRVREGEGLPGRRPPQLGGGAGLLSPRWDPAAGASASSRARRLALNRRAASLRRRTRSGRGAAGLPGTWGVPPSAAPTAPSRPVTSSDAVRRGRPEPGGASVGGTGTRVLAPSGCPRAAPEPPGVHGSRDQRRAC